MQLGFFGGTFNPVHEGHLQMAKAVHDAFSLDCIHFVPSFKPVHKGEGLASAAHRKAMLALALQGVSWARLDTIEYERAGFSYSIDTIEALQKRYPEAGLYFIIGEDSLYRLQTWHRWQDIVKNCRLVVVPRAGSKETLAPEIQAYVFEDKATFMAADCGIYRLEVPLVPISATDIRSQTKGRAWLPAAVWAYIKQHHLYF